MPSYIFLRFCRTLTLVHSDWTTKALLGIERILDIESPEEDGYRFRPALDIETFWKGLSEAVFVGRFVSLFL